MRCAVKCRRRKRTGNIDVEVMSRFRGQRDFDHTSQPSVGILLTNLGTPEAPTAPALRRYLAEFLWDRRVVELPRPLWWLILHGVILRLRPARSARLYAKIWTEAGSPLLAISRRQGTALQEALHARVPGPIKVEVAMRYGRPSIAEGLRALQAAGVRRLLVFPLYPQYSATTTASTFDAVADELRTWRWLPELRFVNHYHDEPAYIEALAESLREAWRDREPGQRVLFSFHGLPKRLLLAGDPYHCECHKTARLVAARLGLAKARYAVAFQSRFGREEWLTPYADHQLKEWAQTGVRRVDVVCAGFAADCLETLEEIDITYREAFIQAGGEAYRYIPALNDHPRHIEALAGLALQQMRGWPEIAADYDREQVAEARRASAERARALGAAS